MQQQQLLAAYLCWLFYMTGWPCISAASILLL